MGDRWAGDGDLGVGWRPHLRGRGVPEGEEMVVFPPLLHLYLPPRHLLRPPGKTSPGRPLQRGQSFLSILWSNIKCETSDLHIPSLKTCVDKLFIFAICHTSSLNEIQEFPLDRILWLHKMDLWQGGNNTASVVTCTESLDQNFHWDWFWNFFSISSLGQYQDRGEGGKK